jgi:hypothetical protein
VGDVFSGFRLRFLPSPLLAPSDASALPTVRPTACAAAASGSFSAALACAAAVAFLRPTSRNTGETPCTFIVSLRGKSCTASESLMILWQCMRLTQEFTNRIAASFTSPCCSKRAYSR